jgi:ribosomal protection tetracycline resistance protein
VVSFAIGDLTVNLIDTPGHPDFIAEVERVLGVLDGAVLVVSAVEGVQAQTRVLFRTLRRLGVPTLFFVNKVDRVGADCARVVGEIRELLSPAVVPMGAVTGAGTRSAAFRPYATAMPPAAVSPWVEVLAENDEELLAAWVADERQVDAARLWVALVEQTRRGLVFPVFVGSAITGAGTAELTAGIRDLLPAADGDAHASVSGSVFKVERGPAGEKIAYVRMHAGTLRTRDRVLLHRPQAGAVPGADAGEDVGPRADVGPGGDAGPGGDLGSGDDLGSRGDAGVSVAKITGLAVFDHGKAVPAREVVAGQIATVHGLTDVRIGDSIGTPRPGPGRRLFAPPTLETVVAPADPGDRAALHAALTELAEQDPLINLRLDGQRGQLHVSLFGEVQKEVIQATLATDYGLAVHFHETSTLYVERPTGTGSAVDHIGAPSNPFIATVGLRIDPSPPDTGVRFELDVKLESIPMYVYGSVAEFRRAMTETVTRTLGQGLYGWQVIDCVVTLTDSAYDSPSTGRGDFRDLTPLVLMAALVQAGTVVCEPIHRFRIECPADTVALVLAAVARLRGSPSAPSVRGSTCVLEGLVPARGVHELQRQIRGLTRGEGVVDAEFDHYRPVTGPPPTRPRTDHNPLNRKEYLLHVVRRVPGRSDRSPEP